MSLILAREDVETYLSMGELISQMEPAFLAFHSGAVEMPQRVRIMLPHVPGYGSFMPCCIPGVNGFGIKVNTNFRDNPSRFGLPSILGLVILLDIESGKPLAIMDSTLITASRTAAVSGLAIRYLARESAEILGVLGSGVLSIPHIQAAAIARNIRKVKVYSPTLASRREAFLASTRKLVHVPVEVVDSPEDAVRPADILIVCTNSNSPVLDGRWIQDGACVVAVGNATPKARELDSLTVIRSRIACDSWKSCVLEAGDLLIPRQEGLITDSHIKLDLAEVLLDPSRGRSDDKQITLFKSVGLAFQDIVAACHVYQQAVVRGDARSFDFNAPLASAPTH